MPSLALLPMASPVLSSVAECVTFYSDSLTKKQRCGLRFRAGSLWRVGTACSGTDSVVKVLEHLGRSSGWHFEHTFSCERDDAKQTWLQDNFLQLAPLLTRKPTSRLWMCWWPASCAIPCLWKAHNGVITANASMMVLARQVRPSKAFWGTRGASARSWSSARTWPACSSGTVVAIHRSTLCARLSRGWDSRLRTCSWTPLTFWYLRDARASGCGLFGWT